MSVYGNFITESQVNPVNKVKESLCEIESVVYNEYCNYKSLLESCTDDNERESIIEAFDITVFVKNAATTRAARRGDL